MDFIEGEFLYFNKPLTWTSFKLVAKVRNIICKKLNIKKLKVGHAGTLDPLATGVLILCTGKATKRIEDFQYQTKEYIATLELGATTPSFDREKPIDHRYGYSHVTSELVEKTLKKFIGRIEQIPPAFSACKVDGKRAYEIARKGEEVHLKPKILVIDKIELIDYQLPIIKIRVVCSKGTYIRALARDLGEELECGAHLTALCRTRIGDIHLDDCQNIEDFAQNLMTWNPESSIENGCDTLKK
jgi:tRNA pseudouridine 55 synthase